MTEIDPNTGLSVGDQPLPWDTAYQDKWATFVAAFGAHYESNPTLSYVVIGGFMQAFNTSIAATDADFNAIEALAKAPPTGYPGLTTAYADFSAAYVPAAEKVIGMFATNFATTPLLTLYRVVPGDLGVTLQNVVPDWAKLTYPKPLRHDGLGPLRGAGAACAAPGAVRVPERFPDGLSHERSSAALHRSGPGADARGPDTVGRRPGARSQPRRSICRSLRGRPDQSALAAGTGHRGREARGQRARRRNPGGAHESSDYPLETRR